MLGIGYWGLSWGVQTNLEKALPGARLSDGEKHNFVRMPECPIPLLRDLLNTRVTFAPGQMSIKVPPEQACKLQAVPQRE